MLLRKLVVVGLVGFVSFAANIATAEDAVGPSASFVGASGVDFADPSQAFGDRFQLNLSAGRGPRFTGLTQTTPSPRGDSRNRGYEVVPASPNSGVNTLMPRDSAPALSSSFTSARTHRSVGSLIV